MTTAPAHTILPYDEKMVAQLKLGECSFIEIENGDQNYRNVCKFLVNHSRQISSFLPAATTVATIFDPYGRIKQSLVEQTTEKLTLGLGVFKYDRFTFLHQIVGAPVATNCSAIQFRSLIIFTPKSCQREKLANFLDRVEKWNTASDEDTYTIYTFSQQLQYWKKASQKFTRPLASVILKESIKTEVFSDADEFVTPETAKWYQTHGIPYKRSYLFYGPPGTGKSSLVQVLAGHLRRNLCFLQPSDPKMTDEALAKCLLSAPKNSVIVLEDIDALFSKDRKTTQMTTPMTFSGLLNALDGVANPEGQIFVLTTNYVDRLDPALIRSGRVDVKVLFSLATRDQVANMFLQFFPGEDAAAADFAGVVSKRFILSTETERGNLSMAALQQHFIRCRKMSAKESVAAFDLKPEILECTEKPDDKGEAAEDKEGKGSPKENPVNPTRRSTLTFKH
eukprot:TRINITY_DN1265_c0_g1_i2.p1 TRINITY_DN1265_c0_g1~~TRINITY_DN1265_c0_g1_i2.p1  ORF type:complete len:458 (+),score=68.06 TRINITY_DN1265_c0_g1_i2:27-1376(+)